MRRIGFACRKACFRLPCKYLGPCLDLVSSGSVVSQAISLRCPAVLRRILPGPVPAIAVLSLLGSSVRILAQSTAVSSVAPPSTIYELEPLGQTPETDQTQPLVDWLPIWGKDARDKGFDLPLPMGVGLTYSYIHQNMVVSDLIVEGRPVHGLTFNDAPTATHTGVFRADLWVFPFLNIYGLVGETAGTTQPEVVFPNGTVVKSSVDYNRFSYGGGLTLAGGYKAFFLTIDANYTTGPIVSTKNGQIGDKPIESLTVAPRLGMLLSSGGRLGTGSIWIGGMCLKATSEIHDSIDLSHRPRLSNFIGRDDLDFSIHVEPKDQWNLLLGGNWQFNKRWSVTAELGGVFDRFQVITAVMWRF